MRERRANEGRIEARMRYMSLKYHFMEAAKRFPGKAAFFVFLVAALVFCTIFIPRVRRAVRACAYLPKGQQQVCLRGQVYRRVWCSEGGVRSEPAAGTIVEAGGFRSTSNAAGTYELSFPSETRDSVPIVYRCGNQEMLRRVSFPSKHDVAYVDVTLPWTP